MNDLALDWPKEVKQLQNDIKLNELDYKAKSGKNYNFSKMSLCIIFLRNMHV